MLGRRYIWNREQLGPERAEDLARLEEEFWNAEQKGVLDNQVGFTSLYVTGKCHLKCPHCHAEEFFEGISSDAPTEQVVKIINGLSHMSGRVQLTGGEIFVRTDPATRKNDVPLLVDEIHRRGRETIMQTTGMHLTPELMDFFAERGVTWMALSLDGPDEEYNGRIRGTPVAFTKVLEIIPQLKQRGFKIKVGTAITSLNQDIEKILELGRLVVSLNVDHWKLYQFYGREIGRTSGINADTLAVSDSDYNAIMDAILAEFGQETHTSVIRHDLSSFYNAPCLLVQPNGMTTIMEGTKDVYMGNVIKDDAQDILTRLSLRGSTTTITANSVKTY